MARGHNIGAGRWGHTTLDKVTERLDLLIVYTANMLARRLLLNPRGLSHGVNVNSSSLYNRITYFTFQIVGLMS